MPEDDFARAVRDALNRLYDPVYLQTQALARLLPAQAQAGGKSVGDGIRQSLLQVIADLRPSSSAADPVRWRAHRLLSLRYVDAESQATVQKQLAIGRSQYYREQRRALEAVTSLLRERWVPATAAAPPPAPKDAGATGPLKPRETESARALPNLPIGLTAFVGRECELADVGQLVQTTRLLTLTGAGGCGKTRLALEVATRLEHEYKGGVRLVELAPLADPELVPQTVASATGVRERPGEPILTTLCRQLRSRHVLLLLDNCEHVRLACAQLAERLLRSCPQLQILATSREALGVWGEVRWRVPSLEVPPETAADVEEIAGYAAVQLFVDRARAVSPEFALDRANVDAVVQICRRLDGIPLAIELAAALMRFVHPDQVASRLGDRFRLLVGGSPTALPRHQTLRATIDWSHDLLSAGEKAVFRRLAVFAGGWTLEAAEVVGSGGSEASPVMERLAGLVDKSLVAVDQAMPQIRYRFLETVRQYAWERLAEAEEVKLAQRRHAEWFAALADRAYAGFREHSHAGWVERLALEHDNIRAALEYCRESDPEGGLTLAASTWRFWRLRGYTGEGRRWLETFLKLALTPSAWRARALLGAGCLAYEQGDYEAALPLIQESVSLARALGNKPALVNALHNLGGTLLAMRADTRTIGHMFAECLSLSRETGDRWGEGLTLLFLGRLAFAEHRYKEARRLVGEGTALLKDTGDLWNFASGLWDVGWLALAGDDARSAQSYFTQMAAIADRLGDKQLAGFASLGTSLAALAVGDRLTAKARLKASVSLFREIDSPGVLDALSEYGHVAVQQGSFATGVRLFAVGERGRSRHGSWRILLYREAAQARWATSMATARAALGEEAYSQAWVEGETLGVEQAIALATALE